MKITLNSLNNSEITLDVNHIGSISALNPYTESFKLITKDGKSYDIVYSQYNDVLAVIGSAGGGGGSTEYQGLPVVQTTERDLTLEANKYYIFGKCETLTIDIGEPITDGKLNEYRFEFISGATPTVLTLPNYLTPVNIQPNTKYVISIKNNVVVNVWNPPTGEESYLRSLIGRTITEIVIPEGITTIPAYMFYQCPLLTKVTLPSTIKTIGTYAFYQCTSLTEINFPEGLVSIGAYAFYQCPALLNVTFPSTLTSLDNYAFAGCTVLQNVTLPETLLTIANAAFHNCRNISTMVLPEGTSMLYPSIFQQCIGLVSVTIPSTVQTLNTSCFNGCTSLARIEIPNSVTTIAQQAFDSCIALRDILMYDSVISLTGAQTFRNINSSCKVRILGTTRVIPFLLGCPNTIEFYVDSTMVQAYKTNSAWSARASYIHSLEEYTP